MAGKWHTLQRSSRIPGAVLYETKNFQTYFMAISINEDPKISKIKLFSESPESAKFVNILGSILLPVKKGLLFYTILLSLGSFVYVNSVYTIIIYNTYDKVALAPHK